VNHFQHRLIQLLTDGSCDEGAALEVVRLEFRDQPWLYSALQEQILPN
jgi:hypothetical protein